MSDIYTTTATAHGGRAGRVVTDDGLLDLELDKPEAMGGSENPVGPNPEQLFAAGYAGCFHGALRFAASKRSVDGTALSLAVEIGIGKAPEGGFRLRARIDADMGDLDEETARELVETAHEVCPYSRATRGNIDVEIVAHCASGALQVA